MSVVLENGVTFEEFGDGWQYAQESATTAFTPGAFAPGPPVFLTDKNGNPFQSDTEYRFFSRHPLTDPEPILHGFIVNGTTGEVKMLYGKVSDDTESASFDTLDIVAKRGTPDQIGKTTQLVKLLGGLVLGTVGVSTDKAQTLLTMDSDGRVWQQLQKNLLALVQAAALAYTGKPTGDIPDIMAILYAQQSDSNVAAQVRRMVAIGAEFGSGSGTGSDPSGTPWVVKSKRCFKRNLTSILDESITNEHLTFGAVSFDKTDFVRSGLNLYNKDSTHNIDDRFITNLGGYQLNPDYTVSHPIPAKPLTAYTPTGDKQFVAYFDAYGICIGGASFDRTNITFITPVLTAYLRLTVPTAEKPGFMLVEGDTLPTVYTPFELLFLGKTAGEAVLSRLTETMRLILASGSVNLYDKDSAENTPDAYIDNLGNYTSDSNNSVSALIPVRPDTDYTASYPTFITYYDAAREVTGAGALFSRTTGLFHTSSGTHYIRVTIPNNRRASFMVVEGIRLPASFQPFRTLLDSITPNHQTALTALDIATSLNALIQRSDNLFNKDTVTPGKIMDTSGNQTDLPGYSVSDYIEVEPDADYTPTEKQYITFFDSAQVVIAGPVGAYDRATLYVRTPVNAQYVRLTVANNTLDYFQFEVGTVRGGYQAFTPVARITTPQGTEALTKINRLSGLFEPTRNLYNKATSGPSGFYIDNTGAINPISGYSVSDYIELKPATTYTPTDKQFVAFYDQYKAPITSTIGLVSRATLSFITPAGTTYARITVPDSLKETYQLEEGGTATPYVEYGQVSTSDLKVSTAATGKRILWVGTSIGAGETAPNTFANPNSYPNLACAKLLATCINQCIPSSSYRIFDKDGTYAGMNWQNAAYSLGHTLTEKNALISNWSTIRTQFANGGSSPATLSTADQNFIRACSYENRLKPYLDGTNPMPDAIVFGAPYNDVFSNETEGEYTAIPATYNSRNTAIGAINYLIDYIHGYAPRMKIALEGHYENQLVTRPALASAVLSDYWGFPLWKIWNEVGFSQRKVMGTAALWDTSPYSNYKAGAGTEAVVSGVNQDMTALRLAMPDNVHPSSDPTGEATRRLAISVRNHLTELF